MMKRVFLAASMALVVSTFAPASAAGVLGPGTYRQLSPTTMRVVSDANRIDLVRSAGGLRFSVNATRAVDHNNGYIDGTLPRVASPVAWTNTDPTIHCRLTFTALPGMRMKVVQDSKFGDCGFGYGVVADGTYLRISAHGKIGNANGP